MTYRGLAFLVLVLLAGAGVGFSFSPRAGAGEIDAVRKQVSEGDAAAVPVLKQWLANEWSGGAVGAGSERLRLAIWGVGEFELDAAGATLSALYQDVTTDAHLREQVVLAAAKIGTSGARRLLLQAMTDQRLSQQSRYEAAAALVPLGEEGARDFLIGGYKSYLIDITSKHSWNQGVRDAIQRLTDTTLMEQLEALKPLQTDQRARNNITSLLDVMRINALDTEELLKLAEETDWARGMYKRYNAIAALGHKGPMEVIPRLEKLQPWANGGGTTQIQQNFVREYAERAIGSIKRRQWQKVGVTQPRPQPAAPAARPITAPPTTKAIRPLPPPPPVPECP